jgi:nucleoside-diphosphate-sugar epimerase
MNGKKITLIGGAGFIGHNLALHLKGLGADVSIIDSLQVNNLLSFSSTNKDIKNRSLYLNILHERQTLLADNNIPLIVQDARNYFTLSQLISEIDPQVVIQLAAVSHADKSNKDPFSTFDHSFRTLENALDSSRGSVEHFIYFSSSMVYGHFKESSVNEDTICEPLGIYGALKYGGEKLVIAYNQVFDLPYTIIRPSALYGERCVSRRVGQIFIENALTGGEIILSGDGSDELDFTYIGDLVRGVEKIIENENSRGQIFNLTYGAGRSLGEMAEIIKSHFPDIKITYQPKDNLTADRGTLSIDKAREIIGYEPQFPLEKGYEQYIQWYGEFWDSIQ